MVEQRTFDVAVAGGRLGVHDWGPAESDRLVIAAHGITANALSFTHLAGRLADSGIRVLAPDLRGRADSSGIAGPWGIGRHAEDLIALADAVGSRSFAVLGHSKGAFVGAVTAARHPDRVSRLVAVDGGVGFPAPAGTDIDELLTAVIGPAMTRLSMSFAGLSEYLAYFSQNPAIAEVMALGPAPAAALTAYLEHDLVAGPDGRRHSSCVLDAIRTDGGQVLSDAETLAAVRSLQVPTTMLWAPRGLMNDQPGLYTAELLAAAGLPDAVRTVRVPDCNHYSVLFVPQALAAIERALLGDDPR